MHGKPATSVGMVFIFAVFEQGKIQHPQHFIVVGFAETHARTHFEPEFAELLAGFVGLARQH